MPAVYGVADTPLDLLPWSWAEERLTDARQYMLATVSASGAPQLMPIWGVWMDGALYFSTHGASRKARNLAANARCAVSVERGEQSVMLEGTASTLTDDRVRARLIDVYTKKYEMGAEIFGSNPIFCVRPEKIFGFDDATFPTTATRWTP
jgi:nitroimidazol reductase NimA-like FMN-containing flavoprotein (pyridoxamine 5'-phosphate oxidase superfamily)